MTEEKNRGLIRWLRPEFKNPASGKQATQAELELDADEFETTNARTVKGKAKRQCPRKGRMANETTATFNILILVPANTFN